MHFSKLDSRGVGHYLIIGGMVGVLAIGSVGTAVYKAGHKQTESLQRAGNSSSSNKSTTLATSAKSQDGLEATQTSNKASAPAAPTTTKTQSKAPASTTPAAATTVDQKAPTVTSAPTAPAQPTATPLSVLTEVISNFETSGGPLNVTRDTVAVAGPISNATAKPIVFGYQNKIYFAYTQTYKPNFGTSAAATASSMAIIPANVTSIAQVAAHLDKSNNLVDQNISLVGYSTGGN